MTIYKETGLHRHPEGKERDYKAISRASNRPTGLAPLLRLERLLTSFPKLIH